MKSFWLVWRNRKKGIWPLPCLAASTTNNSPYYRMATSFTGKCECDRGRERERNGMKFCLHVVFTCLMWNAYTTLPNHIISQLSTSNFNFCFFFHFFPLSFRLLHELHDGWSSERQYMECLQPVDPDQQKEAIMKKYEHEYKMAAAKFTPDVHRKTINLLKNVNRQQCNSCFDCFFIFL